MDRFKTLCLVVLSAIADLSDGVMGGVPSGHLYASLMGQMDLTTYQRIIETIKSAGWVTESGHLLTATERGKAIGAKVNEALKKT